MEREEIIEEIKAELKAAMDAYKADQIKRDASDTMLEALKLVRDYGFLKDNGIWARVSAAIAEAERKP